MRNSPYYKDFEGEASSWEKKLNKIHALFDIGKMYNANKFNFPLSSLETQKSSTCLSISLISKYKMRAFRSYEGGLKMALHL